jgi:hypothetical protein
LLYFVHTTVTEEKLSGVFVRFVRRCCIVTITMWLHIALGVLPAALECVRVQLYSKSANLLGQRVGLTMSGTFWSC